MAANNQQQNENKGARAMMKKFSKGVGKFIKNADRHEEWLFSPMRGLDASVLFRPLMFIGYLAIGGPFAARCAAIWRAMNGEKNHYSFFSGKGLWHNIKRLPRLLFFVLNAACALAVSASFFSLLMMPMIAKITHKSVLAAMSGGASHVGFMATLGPIALAVLAVGLAIGMSVLAVRSFGLLYDYMTGSSALQMVLTSSFALALVSLSAVAAILATHALLSTFLAAGVFVAAPAAPILLGIALGIALFSGMIFGGNTLFAGIMKCIWPPKKTATDDDDEEEKEESFNEMIEGKLENEENEEKKEQKLTQEERTTLGDDTATTELEDGELDDDQYLGLS